MRWNNLFDDLESQLEHELSAEDVDLKAEEERLRLGRLSLRDRLMNIHEAAGGGEYSIRLDVGGHIIKVSPTSFGRDWVAGSLIDETQSRRKVVVPLPALASLILDRNQAMSSLTSTPRVASGWLADRLGLTFVLRDCARRRCALELVTVHGTFHGTIDRVGRDHCDLAVHEVGTPRRETSVSQYRIVPIDHLLLVRL